MTRRLDEKTLASEVELPQRCELCGANAECRPYGPKGEQVCFDCGMKDAAAAERAFKSRLDPS